MHFEHPIEAECPANPQTILVAGISLVKHIKAAFIITMPEVRIFICTPDHNFKSSCTKG